MKLQKNTLFALYSVLESASRPARQLSAGEIARKYRISPHHLAKVLHTLARAGVVESVRGVGGGYRFAGNAKRLALMDVIELFERIGAERGRARRRLTDKEEAVAEVLAEIDEIAKATFRSITLATMLKLIERRTRAKAAL
jgi:Rrf2 family nitric oxide-sensitive transcriptional repressor